MVGNSSSKYHSIHKDDLARPMVALSEQAFLEQCRSGVADVREAHPLGTDLGLQDTFPQFQSNVGQQDNGLTTRRRLPELRPTSFSVALPGCLRPRHRPIPLWTSVKIDLGLDCPRTWRFAVIDSILNLLFRCGHRRLTRPFSP